MTTASLIPLETALAHILEQAPPLNARERVPLSQALGRTLADAQRVPADVPPADNSAVDGYALRCADLAGNRPLPVSARIPAGTPAPALAPGTAARLFTGSELPVGADAVVMQEDIDIGAGEIRIKTTVCPGQNIRRRGQDLRRGDLALARGTRLRPQELGLLASMGIAEVPVLARPRVAVLTTGDELVEPGQPLAPGQIYNTNRFTLLGLLTQAGCEVTVCETLRDDRAATRTTLSRAAGSADLVLTSGGVSVGEEDHVRAVLEESGGLSLWRLAIKPGKPLAFGRVQDTPVLGLPGNPAAVLVTFLMVVMPFLRRCQGQPDPVQGERLPALFNVPSPSIRREFVRARKTLQDGRPQLEAYPNQSSGVLSSACWASGLAVVPEHGTVHPGDLLTYYSFAELLS